MVKLRSGALCTRSSPVDCALCLGDQTPFDMLVRERKLKSMLGCFDLLISPSEFLRDRFVAWGIAADRITVLENGVSFGDDALEPDNGSEESRAARFAYFGQATLTKGLNTLVEAASYMSAAGSAKPVIDIHGVTRDIFKALWPDHVIPPNIAFRGRYHPNVAVTLMRRYGWVIIPSVWWENSPVVIQEARAACVPMIAARLGGILEKTRGWSLHFHPGDPIDLARVIEEAADDASLLSKLSERITPPLSVRDFVTTLVTLIDGARADRASTDAALHYANDAQCPKRRDGSVRDGSTEGSTDVTTGRSSV